MLCLTRRKEEIIVIGCPQSDDVMFVQVQKSSGKHTCIGVDVPREIPVVRLEILLRTMEERGQKPSARFLELLRRHGQHTLWKLSESHPQED